MFSVCLIHTKVPKGAIKGEVIRSANLVMLEHRHLLWDAPEEIARRDWDQPAVG